MLAGTLIAPPLFRPAIVRAQTARELVVITYPGQLSEPHRWLADQVQARHPGLRICLVPSDSQDDIHAVCGGGGVDDQAAGSKRLHHRVN